MEYEGNHSKVDQACSNCEVLDFEYEQLNLSNRAKSIALYLRVELVFSQLPPSP